jgi:RNA polymerase sigma factor (sigma-70 family)
MASLASGWVTTRNKQTADAFERLFVVEYSSVAAVAYRVLGDAQAAEDVAQEVFISYCRHHSPSAPYAAAWLRRAAAHTALNVIRNEKRRQNRETGEAKDWERLHDTAQSSLDPELAMEEKERRVEVRHALGRLSAKYATVLALRYSGFSYAEVADALHVRIGQVGTLLRRAEAALKKEMSDGTH